MEQSDQLSAKFDPAVHRSMLKGGTRLTYIPVGAVIERLNDVIGVDKWSLKVCEVYRDAIDPDFIIAKVTISATFEGGIVERDGIGGQRIKRSRDGQIIDLGDEFKGAVSDALKKAAQSMGIGLYLANGSGHGVADEVIEGDREGSHPNQYDDRPAYDGPGAGPRPASPKQVDFIRALIAKALDKERANGLVNWENLTVFTANQVIEKLKALIASESAKK